MAERVTLEPGMYCMVGAGDDGGCRRVELRGRGGGRRGKLAVVVVYWTGRRRSSIRIRKIVSRYKQSK